MSDIPEKEAVEAVFKTEETKNQTGILGYAKLCIPVLLFPVLYFPYTLWWRLGFSELAVQAMRGVDSRLVQLMLTGNNTILLFWCLVTAVVMLTAIVISVLRVRPWYIIPLYIAVMFSLCGIFSLLFYTMILR